MRLSRLSEDNGNVAILFVLAIPLLTAAILLVVDMGRIALTRARLQSAVDMAAYSGAASLAHDLNRIARKNWEIHKAFRVLREEFERNTQKTDAGAQHEIGKYEFTRKEAIGAMDGILAQAAQRAKGIAFETLERNLPSSESQITVNNELSLEDDADPEEQWEKIVYAFPDGDSFVEPGESPEEKEYEGQKYRQPQPNARVSIGIFAEAEVRPLLLQALEEEGIAVRAEAAAQPFGGSIADFARKETATDEDAEEALDEEGADDLYRQALVPMWTHGEDAAGVFH